MRSIALALILAFSLTVPAASQAGSFLGLDRQTYSDMPNRWFGKLKRGIVNIAFSPLEIPFNGMNQANLASSAGIEKDRDYTGQTRNGSFLVGFASGTLTGIGWTVARIGTGVVEIVTFPFEFRFDPVMEPETPLELTFGRD